MAVRMTRPALARATAPLLCYPDHSSRYAAMVPTQPTAAFTGLTLAPHLRLALQRHAAKMGYHSPYWLSRSQIKQKSVLLKPGQTGILLPAENHGNINLRVCNFGDLPDADTRYFFQDVSVPADHTAANKPYVYKGGKWKQPGDQGSLKALQLVREARGFPSNLWLSRDEAISMQMEPKDDASFVSIVDGSTTTLFNADQTTLNPDRFVPAYRAPSEDAEDFGAVHNNPLPPVSSGSRFDRTPAPKREGLRS